MKNKVTLLILALFSIGIIDAQSLIIKPTYLNYDMDSTIKSKTLTSLDTLFAQIKNGNLQPTLIFPEKRELSFSLMKSLSGIEENKKDSISNFYKKQLINIYPIGANQYWISLAYIGQKNNEPILKNIINLVSTTAGNKILFSVPITYLTKTWKSQVVGNITYFFRDKINIERATSFNIKNTTIANKLGLKPEKLNFYLCSNYQEILRLLGYEYDAQSNGKTRDGYGVDANTIFSIMNNEDFSHDLFHFYSAKIRGEIKRNSTVEEGFAYSWGNAYYTKSNGEMIYQKELVKTLKAYLQENTKTSLLELFNNNAKIFNGLAKEISVKSTISSLLCDEVEHKKGTEGIKTLLKCGRGDENFFSALKTLIAIDQTNFDTEVTRLIEQY